MTTERKITIQTWSAIAMLFMGSVMAFTSLLLPPTGEISDGALWYTGQCFLYSGGIFGISTYTKGKLEEIETKVNNKIDGKRTS